ncbi:hypothetical protein PM082_002118 [Marasmius tenuissimus]|nr:hypothetical protein PM082_002118 [Marasmius tenuissimus]
MQFFRSVSGWHLREPRHASVQPQDAWESPPFEIQGHGQAILVDIPGINNVIDITVEGLKAITRYFVELHHSRAALHGVIFLHPITQTCLVGGVECIPSLLTKLLGQQFLPDVSIVTTKLEDVVSTHVPDRVKILTEFYSENLQGARVIQCGQETPTDGRWIVEDIMNHRRSRRARPLQMQIELAYQGRSLGETGIGSEIILLLITRFKFLGERILKIAEENVHDSGQMVLECKALKDQQKHLWDELQKIMDSKSSVTIAPRESLMRKLKALVGIQTTNAPTYSFALPLTVWLPLLCIIVAFVHGK